MDTTGFDCFLGTLWSEAGASLLRLAGPGTDVVVTAPPREGHSVSDSSRILRVEWVDAPEGHYRVLVSHRSTEISL